MHETLNYQRKRENEFRSRERSYEPTHETEIDSTARAERDYQDDAELFAAQVDCVQLSLESGRTPEEIRAQFNLDADVWMRALREINGQGSISTQPSKSADEFVALTDSDGGTLCRH